MPEDKKTADEKKLVDALTKQVYTATPDGFVEVFDPATGKRGIFTDDGVWKSGELRYADRQLLGWIGRLSVRRAAGKSD